MYNSDQEKALFSLSKAFLKSSPEVANLEIEVEIQELRTLIEYHEWRYYILNDPLLSDFEYDTLYKRLQKRESENPALITPNSPTQRVSSDLSSDFNSVEHLSPMLSLDNSYNAEDLKDWDAKLKRFLNIEEEVDIAYTVEPKYDGGSIALIYEKDQLNRAATRGNGQNGEEITNNARAIYSIPLKAKFSEHGIGKIELRGEVLIRKDRFKKMNAERAKQGLSLFANSRNTASGGLRMKDPKAVAKRNLEAFVYTVAYIEDKENQKLEDKFETHFESLELLENLGFKVPRDEKKLCKNIAEAIDFCLEWETKRDGYDYEIDGMVVKVNDRILQSRAGHTSHHPRWAIAFKFKAKQASTKLLNIEYQVGKVGSITPVAKLEPVALAGVTISSVSLHNEDFIMSKDLRIGDTVLVERAGDVIPYIVKAMDTLRDGTEQPIEFPKFCPINTTDEAVALIRAEGEAAWRCPDCKCGVQDLQRIIFHVSKNAMDIDGLGKSIVERFQQLGWIKNIADIYRLDYDKIAEQEGFGEKSAQNLKASIEKAKKNPIHRLLHSLSVHHLGKKASKLIAAEIAHVLDLQNWTAEDFTNIKDIGPTVAENVIAYFSDEKNIELLKEMEAAGVNMTQTEEDQPTQIAEDAPLAGKTILFTGTLKTMSRKEAQEKATAAGAKNISAVSGNLNILVAGEKAGSKLKKATALGTVEILSEEAFLELLS